MMCTGLAKFFSCVQAGDECEEHDRCQARKGKDYSFDKQHRQQLMALGDLSAETWAQRQRAARPQPAARAGSPISKRQRERKRERERERERDSYYSYTAMERHDQIVEEIDEQTNI